MYPGKETILVPTDFTEQSMIALNQSYNIARHAGAEIVLLHVITGKLDNTSNKIVFNDDLDNINDELNRISAGVKNETGLNCSFIIEKGRIVPTILKYANKLNTSFIILGTRKMSIGPISMRIINEAPCPVISIKGKYHREGCKKIILPLDLTKNTTEKIDITKNLALFFKSQVNVVSIPKPDKQIKLAKMRLLLEQVRDYFVNNSVAVTTKLLNVSQKVDIFANELIKYSEDSKGDLIVIMIRQENPLKERIIGSLAKKIIMESDIPVLCVKPEQTLKNRKL